MKTGPLHISEFERLIASNIFERCNGFSFHSSNASGGARKGIPTDTTLVIGHPRAGEWINVATPWIPERNQMEWNPHMKRDQLVIGWRPMLINLVTTGVIRLGNDVRKVLGAQDADRILQDKWRVGFEDPEEIYWKTKQIPSVAQG